MLRKRVSDGQGGGQQYNIHAMHVRSCGWGESKTKPETGDGAGDETKHTVETARRQAPRQLMWQKGLQREKRKTR